MRQLKISRSITSRNNEALDRYLNEIAREPMLTPEEEAELATKIHKGGKEGEQARDRLVSANLRFVVSVAKQYQNQGIFLTDLINEGNMDWLKQQRNSTKQEASSLYPMQYGGFGKVSLKP